MSPQNGFFFLYLFFKCRIKFLPCHMWLCSPLPPLPPGNTSPQDLTAGSCQHPSHHVSRSVCALQGGRALLIIPQDDRGIGHVWGGAEHRLWHGGAGHGAARSHRIPERGRGRQRRWVFQGELAGGRLLLLLVLWVLLINISLNELQLLTFCFLRRGRQGLPAEGGCLERWQGRLLRRPHAIPWARRGEHGVEVGDASGQLVDHPLQLLHERSRLQGQGLGGLVRQEEVGLLRRGLQWGCRCHPPVHHHWGAAWLVEADGLSLFFLHHIVQSLATHIGKSQALGLAVVAFSEGFDHGCLIAPCLLALHMHWESVPHVLALGSLSSTWFRPWHRLSIRTMNKIKMGLFAFTLHRHGQYSKQAYINPNCFASLTCSPTPAPLPVLHILPEILQKETTASFNSSSYSNFHPKEITPQWLCALWPSWKAQPMERALGKTGCGFEDS